MIKYFIDAWDKNKDRLRKYIESNVQGEYAESYEDLFGAVIDNIIDGYNDIGFCSDTRTIAYGDYQGTLILAFAEKTYQPSVDETFYTVVQYGSCCGCDTLQRIAGYDYGDKPDSKQVEDYMMLCLHMIQNIKCFGNIEDNWQMRDYR